MNLNKILFISALALQCLYGELLAMEVDSGITGNSSGSSLGVKHKRTADEANIRNKENEEKTTSKRPRLVLPEGRLLDEPSSPRTPVQKPKGELKCPGAPGRKRPESPVRYAGELAQNNPQPFPFMGHAVPFIVEMPMFGLPFNFPMNFGEVFPVFEDQRNQADVAMGQGEANPLARNLFG